MNEEKEQNNERPNDIGSKPTRSFDSSNLGPNSQIGQFRIEQELGRGAAGVVYLAYDTKLDRFIAIKSIPAELLENPKVRSRFSREARVLASLNHPNIATIYDEIREADGVSYIILEYVPGQTLAERIAESKLNLKEALTIALQIAEAVSAAHDHDVIHRDLKPGNIKITPEEKVKVLDFGLAKVMGTETSDQHSTITEPGRVIGTPSYMSPEQARGKPVDKRCDIWSFGCVLYEILTGKVPFEGETISDTLAHILQTEPDWQVLPQTTPVSICVILHRCFEKDPNKRLRDIGDAAIEIRETLSSLATKPTLSTYSEVATRHKSFWQWILGIAFVILIVIMTVLLRWNSKPPIQTPRYFPIGLPKNQMLSVSDPEIAVSPDGRHLVYVGGVGGTTHLFLREVDQITGRELPETEGAYFPFFSPDGQSIGFGANGKLKTLSLDSGRPKILCDATNFAGGTWCKDDTIFFCPTWSGGLFKISADGGVPVPVTSPDDKKDEYGHYFPEALPSGDVLFTIWKTTLNDAQIAVLPQDESKSKILIEGASHARYTPTGHLLYAQFGTLMAAPFDIKQLKLKVGEAQLIIKNINQIIRCGYAPSSFSKDGTLYYVRGGDWLARREIVWIDRHSGNVIESPLSLEPGAYSSLDLSSDSQKVAFTKFYSGAENIWVCNVTKGPPEKVTLGGNNFFPIWKPDDNKLTFTSYRDGPFGVYWKSESINSPEEPLVTGEYDQIAKCWSPDGKVLLFSEYNPDTGIDIWQYSIDDGKREPLPLNTQYDEYDAVFSPDGNWIAYTSNKEGGYPQVYVVSYPEPVVNKKISTDGGCYSLWSANGTELFYCNGNKMMSVIIETKPEIKVSEPNTLFEGQYYMSSDQSYDVSDDGKRFLMIKSIEEEDLQLIVVTNFFEEIKRFVTTGKD